jgi:hypothetical protein
MIMNIIFKKPVFYLLLFYAIAALYVILFFDGTGDAGDSISHYLFARYAPNHPELFFHHWAKPLFVLLFSPFAQFGMVGVKILNALIALVTIFVTYLIAQQLKFKNSLVVVLLMIFSPLYFILTFSGLTEPLFALFIAISIYCCLKQKYIAAAILISFLPFIRSEGLIIIGVFGLYFLFKKQKNVILYLLTGHLVYSVTGSFVHGDLLWVFNKIPYANIGSPYGSGRLFHFTEQFLYVVGVPVYFLFWLGFIRIIWKIIKRKILSEELILVFLGFLCFFVAHTLFWYFGIFNSLGLKRVLIGVIPLICLISLHGYNLITEELWKNKKIPKLITHGILIAYLVIFPFTSNPAAINWERDMKLSIDQKLAIRVADKLVSQYGNNHRYVYAHPYLAVALKMDYFDYTKRLELYKHNLQQLKKGDIVIWENWFAVVESGISKEQLDTISGLKEVFTYTDKDRGRDIIYAVYEKQDSAISISNGPKESCSTFDCLEKNKNKNAIISGLFRKYTPNNSGKGKNHMFWDWEILLDDGVAVPVISTNKNLNLALFENKNVQIDGLVFHGIIIGCKEGQNATGFRIDAENIENNNK